jgi:putative methionine-R-sulfoxide reductase with GAF domain
MNSHTKKPKVVLSLTATLALAFIALSTFVLFITSALEIVSTIRAQQIVIAERQLLLAQDSAQKVNNFIQEKFNVLDTATHITDLTALSPESQKQILDSLLSLQPGFSRIALLDDQGQTQTQVSRRLLAMSQDLANQLDNNILTQLKAGEKYISSVYIDPITSEPLVLMMVPVTNVSGDFVGAMISEVNLRFMWLLVEQLEVGETGEAYVVDKMGNLLAYREIFRVIEGENVANVGEVSEFIRSSSSTDEVTGELSTGIKGTTVIGSFVSLGTPDWAVITEMTWQEAYQAVFQQVIFSGAVMLVMAIVAGLLGVLVARRLSIPIINLTETATQIAGGETSLEASVGGPKEVASLATAFNQMTSQLNEIIDTLENRVAERTRTIELSADVSRRFSTILDPNQLVSEVVELLKFAFDYYHVHIYLFDEAHENLVMVGGTGDAGQKMMEQGHKIPRGKGLVGRACDTGIAVIVEDTARDPGWLPNPLLPETKSEIAVPILYGEEVLGALDVQQNVTGGLGDHDVKLLTSIANQLAIALRNARQYLHAQKVAERQAMLNDILQRIQSTQTIESAMQVAVREVGRLFNTSRTEVCLTVNQDARSNGNNDE